MATFPTPSTEPHCLKKKDFADGNHRQTQVLCGRSGAQQAKERVYRSARLSGRRRVRGDDERQDTSARILFKRLEADARKVLEDRETKIKKLAFDAAKEIDGLMSERPVTQETARKVEATAAMTNKAILAQMKSTEEDAQKAAQDRLKKEARNDANLTEARIRTVVKWGQSVVKLTTSVSRLVASSGADVTAYITIAKH